MSSTEADNIDKQYKNYEILSDAKEKKFEHETEYREIKFNDKSVLAGIFSKISSRDELTRDRYFKFLGIELRQLEKKLISDEIEIFIIDGLKQILQDVTVVEFEICMNILAETKLGTTPEGKSELVALAVQQAHLNDEKEPVIIKNEDVERFILCATHALPYFSATIESTPFIKYACEKLFPLHKWRQIGVQDSDRDAQHLRVLKIVAEISDFCGTLDAPNEKIHAIFNVLREYMPISEGDENSSFKFSHAECLLYVLRNVAKQSVEYFTFDDAKEEFQSLQYLAVITQGNIKKLEDAIISNLPKKSDDDATINERRIIFTALKTTSNISKLIGSIIHSSTIFHPVQLSWIPKKNNSSDKRQAPITFQPDGHNDAKRKKIFMDCPNEDTIDALGLPNDENPWQEEKSALQIQIDDLRTKLIGLANHNEDLQEEINNLKTEVDNLKTEVDNLKTQGKKCTCGAMNGTL
ncbi:apoptosis inhibitor 5 homolog [Sitodiplosis mosellana]|uniref:apoptosis inhibitor 5 homolog n=1 Tax=Sitodiplosis mosellana TaxID=263140 RepID=UPI002444F41D|nr:apoptosis inhibitor 5 homolog [Sitodiplosis mosellana]